MHRVIIVTERPEFAGLTLDLEGRRFKEQVSASCKGAVASELKRVFGRHRLTAREIAAYFCHPARYEAYAEFVRRTEPGNYVDRGESEVTDHVYWSCHHLFVAFSAIEPAMRARQLLAAIASSVFFYDLVNRSKKTPKIYHEIPPLLERVSRENPDGMSEEIEVMYQELIHVSNSLSNTHLKRTLSQATRVMRLVVSAYLDRFHGLFEEGHLALPWLNLLEILHGRERTKLGVYRELPVMITAYELLGIVRMILGADFHPRISGDGSTMHSFRQTRDERTALASHLPAAET